jgi:hypothetical protein
MLAAFVATYVVIAIGLALGFAIDELTEWWVRRGR